MNCAAQCHARRRLPLAAADDSAVLQRSARERAECPRRRGSSQARVRQALVLPFLAWVVALSACGRPPVDQPAAQTAPADTVLRDALLRMGLLDQTVRAGLTASAVADTGFMRATLAMDSALTRRLRLIVTQKGWPGWDMVGRKAGDAAFLVLQHSPSDAFQRELLPRLEKAAAAGQAAPGDVALLTDRVRTHDGRPQRYGTQFRIVEGALVPYPIEDLGALDRLRAEVGLMPMSEYVKLLEQTYDGPVRWPPDATAPHATTTTH